MLEEWEFQYLKADSKIQTIIADTSFHTGSLSISKWEEYPITNRFIHYFDKPLFFILIIFAQN